MGILSHIVKVTHGVVRERAKNKKRSPEWREVRKAFLKDHPDCAACGGHILLQVHHKKPFHRAPELELDPDNLITLCMGRLCHIDIGHGNSFTHYNPYVEKHAKAVRENPSTRVAVIVLAEAFRRKTLEDDGPTTFEADW